MDKYSFLNAAHVEFFSTLYEAYLKNPDSVEPSWRAFFQGFDFGSESSTSELNNGLAVIPAETRTSETAVDTSRAITKEFQVLALIEDYRKRGHLFTKTNPVRERRKYSPNLDKSRFGLTDVDLDAVFDAGSILGLGRVSLREIIRHLENTYCDSLGIEYMYIRNPERVNWIQEWLNKDENHPVLTLDQKKHLLGMLNRAVGFENFLHTKFVGQKRFSLEGNESLIPALDALINRAADQGVVDFVVGMAHRGRLNVLANVFKKTYSQIFSEFESKDYEEENDLFDGDVKYHLGSTTETISESGKKITLSLAPNPSHLETVDAVVEGIARAKIENQHKGDASRLLPILIHGDAAVAGQGIVYEVVQMMTLEGYKTGGTIHIIVNNQIGFTTNYIDARSSTYCTDVAKVTLSPVLHVNADDVEAVVHAIHFAVDFRNRYARDVFVDLLGYRRHGHNEGDEPRYTQPKLYKAIAKHPNPKDIYREKLVAQGVLTQEDAKNLEVLFKQQLEKFFEESKKIEKNKLEPFMGEQWDKFIIPDIDALFKDVNTKFAVTRLKKISEVLTTVPEGKKVLRKTERLLQQRRKMVEETDKLDWGMAETLAYATLLTEGFDVRISGEDVERGTFSHRHAVIITEQAEEELVPLGKLSEDQGRFTIYNSHLSEYGVLGFDYGYAMASPNCLTVWEAQFGDFSNGAQIIMDQYLSAAEDKWKIKNGLVLLLPHGYEGQGAEHSSARMERYLQL